MSLIPGRLVALWQYLADYLRTSLWFVPTLLTIGAFTLAYVMLTNSAALDDIAGNDVWWLHSGSGRDARALLETLLAAMITVTTLVVSITVVVLTLAANQLGPRLIRSFVGDRRTQAALGILIATIAYLLLVLRSLDGDMTKGQVPHSAVTVGSVLSFLCIGILLFFVHHLTRSIVADTVVRRVGEEVDESIRELFPPGGAAAPDETELPPMGDGATLDLGRGGYVQVIDANALVDGARTAGAVITLAFRPGYHLLPRGAHVMVLPASALTSDVRRRIAAAVIMGDERTAPQDPEFGIRQLVEIGLRALSPGINDPFTAFAVIDRLARALAVAMERSPIPRFLRDATGVVRVVSCPITFAGLVDTAYSQLRQGAAGKPDVMARLFLALRQLAAHCHFPAHGDALRRQADMILDVARRSVSDPQEAALLRDHYRQVADALDAVAAEIGGEPG